MAGSANLFPARYKKARNDTSSAIADKPRDAFVQCAVFISNKGLREVRDREMSSTVLPVEYGSSSNILNIYVKCLVVSHKSLTSRL